MDIRRRQSSDSWQGRETFVGQFAKLRNATISFVMPVCLFVCLSVRMKQLGSQWTHFHEIWYLSIIENLSRIFGLHWNPTSIRGTLHEKQYTFLKISGSVLLRMRNVSDKSCTENTNTPLCSVTFFFFENRGKISWSRTGHKDNMAHAHCVMDTSGYKHALRICNSYCFSTATMVARTRLSVTLCVYCLSFRYKKTAHVWKHSTVQAYIHTHTHTHTQNTHTYTHKHTPTHTTHTHTHTHKHTHTHQWAL